MDDSGQGVTLVYMNCAVHSHMASRVHSLYCPLAEPSRPSSNFFGIIRSLTVRRPSSMQFQAGRYFLLVSCSLALLTLAACKSSPPSSPDSATHQQKFAPEVANSTVERQSVNVVVITLDTVRADHLHCYGDNKIKTPTIDTLARNGVLFEKAVAQTPLTGPSHASIFTGENPNVHHVRDTGGFALQPSSVTLATILQRSGWDTAGFISSAVLNRQFGFNQGFAAYDDQIPETTDKITGQPAAARPANVTVDHAIRWLKQQSGKPFMLWLHLYDAHEPYNPPAQFLKQYPNDPYDAEIAFEDQQLGRFMEVVGKKSPASKTLVLLLSDHGEGLVNTVKTATEFSSMTPLSGLPGSWMVPEFPPGSAFNNRRAK